jgi:hypothetical protein
MAKTTKNTQQNATQQNAKVTRNDFDTIISVVASLATGFESVGADGNDGYMFSVNRGYIEVWDNSDRKQANIAIRPLKSVAEKLPLKTWNNRKDIRVTSPKSHKTVRIACYSMDAVDTVLTRLIMDALGGVKRNTKKRTTTAKAEQTA